MCGVGDWRLRKREGEASKSQVCSFALRAQKYFQKMNDSEGGVGGGGRERVEVADAGREGEASAWSCWSTGWNGIYI